MAIMSAAAACATASAVLLPGAAGADPADDEVLAGKTVFLDPGHQESADGHDLDEKVDDGYGGTKACQTSGMTARDGTPEHEIAYNVAAITKGALEHLGADVEMSRGETGWGGCVDERAEKANKADADIAVSIHADSTPKSQATNKHGYHLIVPELDGITNSDAKDAQSEDGRTASKLVRDVYKDNGFSPANYIGDNGIDARKDVAGPALTEVPAVFLEMGNGANSDDAEKLESAEGQGEHASALAAGIAAYLVGAEPEDLDSDQSGKSSDSEKSGESEKSGTSGDSDTSKKSGTSDESDASDKSGTSDEADAQADLAGTVINDVVEMFQQVAAADGTDALLDLLDDDNITRIESLTSALTQLAQPLVSQVD